MGERETRQKSASLPPKAGELPSLLYRCDSPESNPARTILEFFFPKLLKRLRLHEHFIRFYDFINFHVRKVKCLVKATERDMSFWSLEMSAKLLFYFAQAKYKRKSVSDRCKL